MWARKICELQATTAPVLVKLEGSLDDSGENPL